MLREYIYITVIGSMAHFVVDVSELSIILAKDALDTFDETGLRLWNTHFAAGDE